MSCREKCSAEGMGRGHSVGVLGHTEAAWAMITSLTGKQTKMGGGDIDCLTYFFILKHVIGNTRTVLRVALIPVKEIIFLSLRK